MLTLFESSEIDPKGLVVYSGIPHFSCCQHKLTPGIVAYYWNMFLRWKKTFGTVKWHITRVLELHRCSGR